MNKRAPSTRREHGAFPGVAAPETFFFEFFKFFGFFIYKYYILRIFTSHIFYTLIFTLYIFVVSICKMEMVIPSLRRLGTRQLSTFPALEIEFHSPSIPVVGSDIATVATDTPKPGSVLLSSEERGLPTDHGRDQLPTS